MNSSEQTPSSEPPLPVSPPPDRPASARALPKIAFAAASLLTVVALFFALENRRQVQAGPGATAAESAPAERAVAAKLIPPPVPDDQNFAATPFFAALFKKPGRTESNDWPDTFSKADQWPRSFPITADSVDGRQTGRLVTDLVAWQKAFEQSQSVAKTNQEEIVVAERPDPAANAKAAPAVLAALKPYEPVLAELHAANRRPLCRFNVDYSVENPWAILLPQLAVVKRTSQLLRLKTSAELAAGQSAQALQSVQLMLRLVDSPKDEPTLISQLVRVACLQIAIQPIWEGLAGRHWSEMQLELLQARLQQFDFITDLKLALESERAWGNLTIGLVRDKRTPNLFLSMVAADKPEAWQKEAERAFLKCPRDWFDQEQANYNRLFDERVITMADFTTRRIHPREADDNSHFVSGSLRDNQALLKNHLVFAKVLLPALGKVGLKLANAQATVDFAAVACALERHRLATGQYPDTLVTLAPRLLGPTPLDVVDGRPLRYRRTNDGRFLLYSVGWNETDDDGELAFLPSGRGVETKDGDWVWRYPAAK